MAKQHERREGDVVVVEETRLCLTPCLAMAPMEMAKGQAGGGRRDETNDGLLLVALGLASAWTPASQAVEKGESERGAYGVGCVLA